MSPDAGGARCGARGGPWAGTPDAPKAAPPPSPRAPRTPIRRRPQTPQGKKGGGDGLSRRHFSSALHPKPPLQPELEPLSYLLAMALPGSSTRSAGRAKPAEQRPLRARDGALRGGTKPRQGARQSHVRSSVPAPIFGPLPHPHPHPWLHRKGLLARFKHIVIARCLH